MEVDKCSGYTEHIQLCPVSGDMLGVQGLPGLHTSACSDTFYLQAYLQIFQTLSKDDKRKIKTAMPL